MSRWEVSLNEGSLGQMVQVSSGGRLGSMMVVGSDKTKTSQGSSTQACRTEFQKVKLSDEEGVCVGRTACNLKKWKSCAEDRGAKLVEKSMSSCTTARAPEARTQMKWGVRKISRRQR